MIHNTALNVLTHVVTALINFFLINFLVGSLGQQRYGIWVLVASIFQYRMLLNLGLNSAINRYIPVSLAKGDSERLNKIISTSFFFLLTVGLILVFLTILVYFKLGNWFQIQPEDISSARVLVLIVGCSFAAAIPMQMSSAVLSGLQRYDIINLITLGIMITRAILLVILLCCGYGLLTMGLIYGGSEITIRLWQFFFSSRLLPGYSISIKAFDFYLLKEMTFYGVNTVLYTLGAMILYKASDIMVGMFLGTSQISQFSISVMAVFLLTEFTQVFSSAVKPAISDLDARSDTQRIREMSFLTQKYTFLMLIPACCFFVVMGREFLTVWVGNRFQDTVVLEMMASILTIMAIAHTIRLAQHSNFIVLVGRGEHGMFGIFTLVTAGLFVVISVICLKILNFGLVSVAWANFIPVVLVSGIFLPLYFNRKMQITFKETAAKVWIPALMGTLPAVILILAWKYTATPDSWSGLIAVVITAAAATSVGSWLFSFSQLEKMRFVRLITRK